MKIFVGQIYIEAGVSYPFSLSFQKWLGNELSRHVEWTGEYSKNFSNEYKLGFRISAKRGIVDVEIKGPTVFKKDKTVEFTLFLPFKDRQSHAIDSPAYHDVFVLLVQCIADCLTRLGLDTFNLRESIPDLIKTFSDGPRMLKYLST